MKIVKTAIVTGVILIALGVIGYFAGGMVSVTALIPAFAGIPILLGGLIAKNPDKLKLGMHLAAVFGLLGVIAPLGRLIPLIIKGEFEFGMGTASMILMALICLVFTIQCVKSFKEARRARA